MKKHKFEIIHLPKFVICTFLAVMTFVAIFASSYLAAEAYESQAYAGQHAGPVTLWIMSAVINTIGSINFCFMAGSAVKYTHVRHKPSKRAQLRESLLHED